MCRIEAVILRLDYLDDKSDDKRLFDRWTNVRLSNSPAIRIFQDSNSMNEIFHFFPTLRCLEFQSLLLTILKCRENADSLQRNL